MGKFPATLDYTESVQTRTIAPMAEHKVESFNKTPEIFMEGDETLDAKIVHKLQKLEMLPSGMRYAKGDMMEGSVGVV